MNRGHTSGRDVGKSSVLDAAPDADLSQRFADERVLRLVDGIDYLLFGVAYAYVVVEPLVDSCIGLPSDGRIDNRAVSIAVVVHCVGASSGEFVSEGRLGDYHRNFGPE